jgi:hypothetical protein
LERLPTALYDAYNRHSSADATVLYLPEGRHVPAEELERQAREAADTDAAIFPSLMLVQTRGDEIAAAPEWLRSQTTVEDYLRGVLG